MHCTIKLLLTVLTCASLGACGSLASPNSPDLVYGENAQQARSLQVPPDLTDISDAEQFVLPGTASAAVARNTLLPEFESARFIRQGAQSWLRIDQSPESLWPRLLEFVREQRYSIDQTEPTAGTIVTRWRAAGEDGRSNLLQNLIGTENQFTRIAFRLERAGNSTRLFARAQAAAGELIAERSASLESWPESSHDPESTSALLARFLVFLGVSEQRARGILNDAQARAVLNHSVIQTTAAGNQLLINYGLKSSFERVLAALEALQYSIVTIDDGLGRVQFMSADESTDQSLIIDLSAQHVSAVSLSIVNAAGRRLESAREIQVLEKLQQAIG